MATWDAEAVSHLYDAEAQMFGSSPELFQGPDGARRYFAAFDAERCVATFDNRAVTQVAVDLIVASGFIDFRVTANGVESALSFRYSFLLRRSDESEWKILLHHASARPATPPF